VELMIPYIFTERDNVFLVIYGVIILIFITSIITLLIGIIRFITAKPSKKFVIFSIIALGISILSYFLLIILI